MKTSKPRLLRRANRLFLVLFLAGAMGCAKNSPCHDPLLEQQHGGHCPTVIDPVCGCDGRSYNNSCEARAAGIRHFREGDC